MAKEIIEQLSLIDFGDSEELDDKYTIKNAIPQYTPTRHEPPSIFTLVDKLKTSALIDKIEKSNVSKQEKDFLRLAAYRHLVFNYSEIAEYYCHATKEMQ